MPKEADLHVRPVQRLEAAELLHVLGLLSDHGVDHVVDGHDAQHACWSSTTGSASRSCAPHQARDILARHHRSDADGLGRGRDAQHRRLRIAHDEAAQGDHLQQVTVAGREQVDGVDRLAGLFDAAYVVERCPNREGCGHGHVFGGHDRAGGSRRIRQQGFDRGAAGGPNELDQPRRDIGIEGADDIRRAVVRHGVEQPAGERIGHGGDDRRRVGQLGLLEDAHRLRHRQLCEDGGGGFNGSGVEQLDRVGGAERAERGRIGRGQIDVHVGLAFRRSPSGDLREPRTSGHAAA